MDFSSSVGAQEDEIAYHHVINAQFDPDYSFLTVMCNATQFRIAVTKNDLLGTKFEEQYVQLVTKVYGCADDTIDDYDAICDWLLTPCRSHFGRLAPKPPEKLTLQAYFHPPIVLLRLQVMNGFLSYTISENFDSLYREISGDIYDSERASNDQDKSDLDHQNPRPASRNGEPLHDTALIVPIDDIPEFGNIPRIKGSELEIVPRSDAHSAYISDVPEKVRLQDGAVKFFKPAFHRSRLIREVETQIKFAAHGLHDKIRVSKLCGIVVSDDNSHVFGLVLESIPSAARNLHSEEYRDMTQWHAKWELQVINTVKALHSHDIVWGDVHPNNIVIDEGLDAWVVDFGGDFDQEFVAQDRYDTKEGDMQGVQKIFHHWINQD